MGMIGTLLSFLFGGGRNAIAETAEVFRENAEAGARRAHVAQEHAMAQLAAEFAQTQTGAFDRLMDAVNRIPRPALALGTLGLFLAAMIDPIWFAARMQGIALVPEPLWWLLGVIVSFYFGARHQNKSFGYQRELATIMARTPQVLDNLAVLERMNAPATGRADTGPDASLTLEAVNPDDNPALDAWRRNRPS